MLLDVEQGAGVDCVGECGKCFGVESAERVEFVERVDVRYVVECYAAPLQTSFYCAPLCRVGLGLCDEVVVGLRDEVAVGLRDEERSTLEPSGVTGDVCSGIALLLPRYVLP